MRKSRTIATAVAGGAFVLLAGTAAVQQQAPPTLDADSLANRLGLSAEMQERIAPEIEELSALLARRGELWEESQDLRTRIRDVRQGITEDLTPEQQRAFADAVGRAFGHGAGPGSWMQHAGPMGRGGHMGGAHMRGDGMEGGRGGAAHMGPGGAMPGGVMPGGSMGGGHMGGGRMGPGSMGAGAPGAGPHMGGVGHMGGNPPMGG